MDEFMEWAQIRRPKVLKISKMLGEMSCPEGIEYCGKIDQLLSHDSIKRREVPQRR